MKAIVLVIASLNYQPTEYGVTKEVIEKAGITVVTASDKLGTAFSRVEIPSSPLNKHESASVDLLIENIDPVIYDGVFLVGGGGAMSHLDTPSMHAIIRKVAELGKPFGAICISPRILAKAGVLSNKKATGWDGDHNLATTFSTYGAVRVQQDVVVDNNIVTADGPAAAQKFGQAIVAVVQNFRNVPHHTSATLGA